MSFSTVRWLLVALLGGAVLLFPADGLRALGLGEARVDSYIGQPLDVTVRLLEAGPDAVEGMTVASASPEDFERLGVPAEALALDLEVTVDRRSDPAVVRVRSRRPVNDPIVQILIDARWANGRVLREYTLFLDPPTTHAPPPARRTAPEAEAPVAERPAEPAPREAAPEPARRPTEPESAPETAPAVATDRDVGEDRVEVRRGDTLWGIAYNWRPDTALSMDQVMLAIFERNRHAFRDENINRLLSGTELDMPALDEVGTIDRAEAERRIRAQMQAWQQDMRSRDLVEVSDAGLPETERTDPVETPEPATESVHRLDVVPPEDDEFADGGVVSEGEIQQVRGAVRDIEEEILADRLESAEFDERIAEIREALSTRDAAGLAVAEEGLAELESRLREARREREAVERESDELVAPFDDMERELAAGEEIDPTFAGEGEPATDEQLAGDPGADAAQTAEPESPMATPAAETSRREPWPVWVWSVLVGAALLLLAVLIYLMMHRAAVKGLDEPVDRVARARRTVDRRPASLDAHLALVTALADREDESGFSDALDEMYQKVEDESDSRWQKALGLAMTMAPDHPLLTPREAPGEDEKEESDVEMDERADELMDMLDADADRGDEDDTQPGIEDGDEDQLPEFSGEELDLPEDEPADMTDEEKRPQRQAPEEEFGEDMDLAKLSSRLDEPAAREDGESIDDSNDWSDDFGAFEEDAEYTGEAGEEGEEGAEGAEGEDEDEARARPAGDEALDLDFEFSSTADPDMEFDDAISDEAQEDRALSDEDTGRTAADEDVDEHGDDEAPVLNDEDADVKLDLARAYISVDLTDSARTILEEVVNGGSESKRAEARKLLDDL